jgi:hypothetical protein
MPRRNKEGTDGQADDSEQPVGPVIPDRSRVVAVCAVVAEKHQATGRHNARARSRTERGHRIAGHGGHSLHGERRVILGHHADTTAPQKAAPPHE